MPPTSNPLAVKKSPIAKAPRKRVSRSKKPANRMVYGEVRDLPGMTPAEWKAERDECFARAWAQKAAREEKASREKVSGEKERKKERMKERKGKPVVAVQSGANRSWMLDSDSD